MTPDDARRILADVTYKPKHILSFEESWLGPYALVIDVRTRDVRGAKRVDLVFRWPIDRYDLAVWSKYDFLKTVEAACDAWERHERKEWLRYQGVPVTEPHPELRTSASSASEAAGEPGASSGSDARRASPASSPPAQEPRSQ